LEEIDITDNKISKLVIKNCPKLKKIDINDNKIDVVDLSGIGTNNVLTRFFANDNELTELNLKNCKKIKVLKLRKNATLTKIKGLEEIEDVDEIDLTGSPNIRLIHEDKLSDFVQAKEAIKDLLGDLLKPNGSLPDSVKENGRIVKSKLKEAVEDKVIVNSPIKNELDAIKVALGLTSAATEDEILDAIQKLKDAGSGSISKTSLTSIAKSNLKGLGISEGDIDKKLGAAASAREVENFSNELINSRFDKLQSKLNTAHYLNAGLGTFSVLITLILV
jgi:Leucine-rich repeat (LRR) protein